MIFLKSRGRCRSLTSSVLVASVLSISLSAFAQKAPTYPVQTISLVVAFSAGGAADIVARSITLKLSALLNTSVVVENKPGANGNIAASYVAKAPADGYTLLMGFPGLASNPSLYKKMTYDPANDLAPIKMLANAPVLLVVAPNSPHPRNINIESAPTHSEAKLATSCMHPFDFSAVIRQSAARP